MKRRKYLIGVATVTTASLAGCLDIFEDGVEAAAQPAKVPEDVANNYGYDFIDLEAFEIDEEIEVSDESLEINITTWTAAYAKDGHDLSLEGDEEYEDLESEVEEYLDQQGAGFAVVSTPSQSIAGQEVNPIAHLSDEELVDQFNDEVSEGEIRDVEHTDSHNGEMFGEEVDIEEFDAVVETENGDEFEVQLYVAEGKSEGDIILAVGVHPRITDERDDILALIAEVEHPVDEEPEED